VVDATHHTFFEMLGNWSLGDPASTREDASSARDGYSKEDAIKMSFEFLTSKGWLGLDKNRIAVSVFVGDEDAPFDEEAFNVWKDLGISEKRIAKLPKENNWWGMERGPCGPDTEIFYWTGDSNQIPEIFNDDNDLWVEIWNDVFLQYNKTGEGEFEPLVQKNVDTGMGLERVLSAINGFDDNYKTELFWPIIQKIEEISGKKYEDNKKSFRIIADHLKAASFIIADGVTPLNVGAGYVLRRLIRRAIRHGKILGIENNFTKQIAEGVVEIYRGFYRGLEENKEKIFEELEKEEDKFRKTLSGGLARFEKFISNPEGNYVIRKVGNQLQKADLYINDEITDIIFDLYQTYGFPLELVFEELYRKEINVDKDKLENKFKERLQKHQELSRTASAGMFKGGLADTSEATKKYHTAAHLMLSALRKVLGDHVLQKGSNITPERLRFDFSHPEKMTDEQKKEVENMVNEIIQKDLPVTCEEMSLEEAKKQGAMGVFENKYGERVKVYTIGDPGSSPGLAPFSREICGGPHISRTGELGKFKIKKEESSSSGVRRIKAILE
jgi:alanyl-tRNA synthetase